MTTSEMRLPLSEYRALAEFRYELRRFLHFSEEAARAVGVEPQQYQLLLAVKGLPPGTSPTITELAEKMQLRHHSTVELVDRLVAKDLIKRTRDTTDRRLVLLVLTPAGEQVLAQLVQVHHQQLRNMAPSLIRGLDKIVAEHGGTSITASE